MSSCPSGQANIAPAVEIFDHKALQDYRAQALKALPTEIGVYALADATGTVRYVGQSVDGIRTRVQRHTTSARSDIIANRLIDAGEIAYVRAYPVALKEQVTPLENHLIHRFNDVCPLMNGKLPPRPAVPPDFPVPEPVEVQIMPEAVRAQRSDPAYLVRRQIKVHADLVDYIIHVKDNTDLRRSLKASLDMLVKHTDAFLAR